MNEARRRLCGSKHAGGGLPPRRPMYGLCELARTTSHTIGTNTPDHPRHASLHLAQVMDVGTLPPVTRLWAFGCVAMSLLEHVSVVSSYSLFYSPSLVFNLHRPQPYRLITSFLYFGEFGIDFLFHLFFFIRYARMLEENHYVGHTADFAWLITVCGSLLLLLGPLISPPIPFLGSPLAFVMVYIWSRRNRHIRLSLFGVLVITAPYLPFALCAFSWMITGSAGAVKGDLLGLAVGHVCECPDQLQAHDGVHVLIESLLSRLLPCGRMAKGNPLRWQASPQDAQVVVSAGATSTLCAVH